MEGYLDIDFSVNIELWFVIIKHMISLHFHLRSLFFWFDSFFTIFRINLSHHKWLMNLSPPYYFNGSFYIINYIF